tara:strand:- start:18 stop:635 length:618 start_codon:yes stop_codon:yes gene_type:complete
MSNYPIIVFEGVEGSGKSLHIKNLEKYLKKKNISYQKLREPGGTKNSEKIRNLILNKKSNFDIKSDLFLYLAARNENYKSIIQKNYKKKVILIDRFTDSTLAYQHYGMGLNKQIIILLNKFILNKINPSFTFLNIVNMKNLKLRLKRRLNKNRYDNFNVKFYNRVQNGYIKLSRNKKKYLIIDSNKNINENKNIIINKINSILSL